MTDIFFSPQNNPGGVCLLSIVPTWGVSFDPAMASNGSLATSAITFTSGYRWFGLYGTDGTKQFSEVGTTGDSGVSYQPKVLCFLPGDTLEHRLQLRDWLRDWPLLILVEDNAGSMRIVGTLDQPMKLTEVAYDTTVQFASRRGTLLTFQGQTYNPAVYVI
ncbi:hypothetical protein [Spirosoma litoris]